MDLFDRVHNLAQEGPRWARPQVLLSALLVGALLAQAGAIAWPALRHGIGASETRPHAAARAFAPRPGLSVAGIVAGHLFGMAEPAAGQAEKTALPLELVGTFAAAEPTSGMAFLREGPGAPQHFYRVGDTLPGGGVLREVYRTRIVFARDGRLEDLTFAEHRLAFASAPSLAALGAPSLPGRAGLPPLSPLPGSDDGRDNAGAIHLDTGGADGEEEAARPPIYMKPPDPGIPDPVEVPL